MTRPNVLIRQVAHSLKASPALDPMPHDKKRRDGLPQSLAPLCKQPDGAVRDPVGCFEEDVVSMKEAPVLLTEDVCRASAEHEGKFTTESGVDEDVKKERTHWYRQRADGDLHAAQRNKHVLCVARLDEPVEALERQAKRKDVLEHQQAREAFNGHVAWVRLARYSTTRVKSPDSTYDAHLRYTTRSPQPRKPYP